MIENIRIFSVIFKEFEDLIIDFFTWFGHINNIQPKFSKITAYFQIFQILTQDQACNLTGFSKGYISTSFAELLKSQILIMNMIPGTHTRIYSLKDKKIKSDFNYKAEIQRLEELIPSLEKIFEKLKNYEDLEGFDALHNRVDNYIGFLINRKEFIKNEYVCIKQGKIFNPEGDLSKNIVFPSGKILKIVQMDKLTSLDPKIIEIENNIIEEICKYNVVRIHDPSLNYIYSFFITRRYNSQISLKNLTGISLSTISRAIKKMKKGYIEQKEFKLGGKQIYEIVPFNVPKYSYNKIFSQICSRWKAKFVEMQQKLQDSSNGLMDLWGYPYIYTIIDRIIEKL